jgi:hypothetical protein
MTPTNTPEAARLAEERQRFEAEAIARTWAYRSEHGLRFYPSHDGGGDLWKGWLAAKQDAAPTSAAPMRSREVRFIASADGRNIDDDDFEHDAVLRIYGDFGSDEQRLAYASTLCDLLNVAPTSASTVPEDALSSEVINRAHILAGDLPHVVIDKLRAARNPGACSVTDGEAKK